MREALRANIERTAAENAIEIEFVRSGKSLLKENRVEEIQVKRGEHAEVVVCILSAMGHVATASPSMTSRTTRRT